MLFRGYIDESYNDRVFTLSAILATGLDWAWFESAWRQRVAAKNKFLKAQGRPQISRFHASDFSSRMGEFSGWTVDEQREFMQDLVRVFKKPKYMLITAYSILLGPFTTVFPEVKKTGFAPFCYGSLIKFLMYETAKEFDSAKALGNTRPAGIVLFHDRSSFDSVVLKAFNQVLGESEFDGRRYFSTIASLGWEKCIPLQAADLVAYENLKSADRWATGSLRPQRKSLAALLDLPSLGGRTIIFDARALQKLRSLLDRSRRERLAAPHSA